KDAADLVGPLPGRGCGGVGVAVAFDLCVQARVRCQGRGYLRKLSVNARMQVDSGEVRIRDSRNKTTRSVAGGKHSVQVIEQSHTKGRLPRIGTRSLDCRGGPGLDL